MKIDDVDNREDKMKNIRGHGGRASNLDFSNETKVAVAIDKDKSSQVALKWTLDNLVTRGQSLLLLHVKRSNINSKLVSFSWCSILIVELIRIFT